MLDATLPPTTGVGRARRTGAFCRNPARAGILGCEDPDADRWRPLTPCIGGPEFDGTVYAGSLARSMKCLDALNSGHTACVCAFPVSWDQTTFTRTNTRLTFPESENAFHTASNVQIPHLEASSSRVYFPHSHPEGCVCGGDNNVRRIIKPTQRSIAPSKITPHFLF